MLSINKVFEIIEFSVTQMITLLLIQKFLVRHDLSYTVKLIVDIYEVCGPHKKCMNMSLVNTFRHINYRLFI